VRGVAGLLLAGALVAGGCGGSGAGVERPSPPVALNLTVYVNDSAVSLSPDSVGAGPVVLIVTNQGSRAESLTLLPAGAPAGQPIASTGPISPQGTAQLKADLGPGNYSLSSEVNGGLRAPTSAAAIRPAALQIGPARPSGSGDLLAP
jgi:hypothetical protein